MLAYKEGDRIPYEPEDGPYDPNDAEATRAYDAKGQVVHLSAAQKTSVYVQIISHNE